MDAIQDSELRSKATRIPELLDAAFAENTLRKYRSAWAKWVAWCGKYQEINYCPADPFFICIYFNDLILEKSSIGTITTAVCGIRWGHIKAGFDSPTDTQLVKTAFKGAKRLAESGVKNRKEPFTSEMISELVDQYGNSKSLIDLRFVLMSVLGFAGFFRISELLGLQVKDLTDKATWYEILVKRSKTDQLREGNIVYVAQTGSKTCPVLWLRKYLSAAKLLEQPESYLFCRLAKTKTGHNAIGHLQITYQTARKSFLEHISFVNKGNSFGLHSLRSGGATTASNNGVPQRLIGKHGRWSSSSSRELYIKDSKRLRLNVSKNLGL